MVNKFIGLCKKSDKWPSILHDLGYKIQLIEQTFSTSSSNKITPDLVAVSQKLSHAIVAECKSGTNINSDQDGRYKELVSNDLKHFVTVDDSNQLSHTICYVDNHKNHDKLEPYTTFPLITFANDSIQGCRDFGLEELNNKLCASTSLKGMQEPTSYYPFSPDDDDYLVVPHVLRGFFSSLVQQKHILKSQINSTEILKRTHSYDVISPRHKKQLIKKIETVFELLLKNKEFSDQIEKLKIAGYNHANMQKLGSICEKLIIEYESQKKITDSF